MNNIMNTSTSTPNRKFHHSFNSSNILEQSIRLCENRRKMKSSLFWGAFNLCMLAVVLYDISHTCPLGMIWSILYLEYALSILFSCNVIFHLLRYIAISFNNQPVVSSPIQKKLMGLDKYENSTILASVDNTPNASLSNTPVNWSAVSWRSNKNSLSDSANFSSTPQSFSYNTSPLVAPEPQFSVFKPDIMHTSPHRTQVMSNSPVAMFTHPDNSGEFINDEESLADYLKGYQLFENTVNNTVSSQKQPGMVSSFWTHPAARTKNETSSFLKGCQYQLSPLSTGSSSSSPSGKSDDKGSPIGNNTQGMDAWRRLLVNNSALTQWNSNIRVWISRTIVERLVKEIDLIDEAMQKHGFSDIVVGGVGLDRLRKTAQMAPVLQFIPTLSTLIPFLEASNNQEYLVKRIRELGKGGCMSEFKWNGGSSFAGKDWNDSLPTDSAIIMHLFSTYMDTQLQPLPNKPDVKPFTGNYLIKYTDKLPQLTPNTLAIHQVSEKPPHYRVIIGEEIYEVIKGYNNIFHSILLFIYHVNKKEHGMLGRVNLGSLGINILWVIDN